jgi:hypothetical protein
MGSTCLRLRVRARHGQVPAVLAGAVGAAFEEKGPIVHAMCTSLI